MSSKTLYPEITIFKVRGYVSAANATQFLEQLTTAIKTETNSILLVDMKEVEFMDSAGLMAMIKGFRLAQSLNKRLSICSVNPSVRMVFELTQLDEVFEIFENRDAFEAALAVN
ncbi:STAS domain-containing protein [Pleurocapsales cyanobacterium LEGE 06147]|nr:STAS domain-containing protein [Pleurocapsales cyanobacterium LEGE 06147]